MIRQQISAQNNTSLSCIDCFQIGQNDMPMIKNTLEFSQSDFIQWLLSLSSENIQFNFIVSYLQAANYLKKNWKQFHKKIVSQVQEIKNINSSFRKLMIETFTHFCQGLLMISHKDYLDSFTFSKKFLQSPEKTYKILSYVKFFSLFLQKLDYIEKQESEQHQKMIKNPQTEIHKFKTLQYLSKIAHKIQKNSKQKMKLNFKWRHQQKYNSILNQFNLYWKHCSTEQRASIWQLGCKDIKKAVSKFTNYQQKTDLELIEQQVQLAKKMSQKQLNFQLFSQKLSQQKNNSLNQYLEIIFKQLKQRTNKKNKPKSKKNKKKKIRQRRLERTNSIDQSSNQTNQTDIIYQRAFDININQIITSRLQKDITTLADQINQQANLYHNNRQLAYQRLRHILAYLNVKPKLYGSCCVGLAIKNSDIDVTIDQSVLEEYYSYLPDIGQKISTFFSYLQYYFTNYSFITNVKIINSAAIPIIKFTIDNNVLFNYPSVFGEQVHMYLNRKIQNPSTVEIDLTVETLQFPKKHLGIISTQKTQKWLRQIPTLQTLTVILKNQLALHMLNQTYYGGINTYTLIVMLVAYIRYEKLTNQTKVSVVLEKVLRFYSEQFQQQKQGINLNSSTIFYPKNTTNQKQTQTQTYRNYQISSQDKSRTRQLQVRDPLDHDRITTRNCYKFKNIKKIFHNLYQNYFVETRKKVQELCSLWNPKQNVYNQQMLLDWVNKQIQENNIMGLSKNQ